MADDLALLLLQPRSQKSYWACVRQLAEHFGRSPDRISAEELRPYFIYRKIERRFSRQSSTQALCAIKLFWEKTLQRGWPAELELARATPQFKLPVALSASEVRTLIARVPALNHRVPASVRCGNPFWLAAPLCWAGRRIIVPTVTTATSAITPATTGTGRSAAARRPRRGWRPMPRCCCR